MTITLIREAEIPLSSWSGGTSREYYIYPPEAAYKEKNFLVRLSTAASHSDDPCAYTDLPGITRHLIILEGTAKVSHEGHHELLMTPYEPVDVFDGGWKTTARGKAVDFNLMLGKGVQGRMSVIDSGRTISVPPRKIAASHEWLGLFFAGNFVADSSGGSAVITVAEKNFILQKGDLLLLEDFSRDLPLINITSADSKIILLDAYLK